MKIKFLALIFCTAVHFSASAQDAVHEPAPGTCADADGGIWSHNAILPTINVADKQQNSEGHKETSAWNVEAGYYVTCDCSNPTDAAVHERTVSAFPPTITEDGHEFYQINEYLQAAAIMHIASHRNSDFDVPFNDESTGEPTPHEGNCYPKSAVWHDAASGKILFRISRPFVGFTKFNHIKLFSLYAARNASLLGTGQPVVDVYISGTVTVPQKCILDLNKIIEMKFGNIAASSFSKAGPGNIPDNVNPQSHNISIQCENIDAFAQLAMRIETSRAQDNIILSDNEDVGFILGDKDRNPLKPNDINSHIPFKLDGNAEANVTITAWPVSVTGKKPREGTFTAEGYLRVDFD